MNTFSRIECQVVVHSKGMLPGAKHDRTFITPMVKLSQESDTFSIEIDATRDWSTVEPIGLGPESVLWQNLYSKILASETYPTVNAHGTIVQSQSQSQSQSAEADVTVTIRGTEVRKKIVISKSGDSWKSSTQLKLSAFGVPKFKALGGLLYIDDTIDIEFSLFE